MEKKKRRHGCLVPGESSSRTTVPRFIFAISCKVVDHILACHSESVIGSGMDITWESAAMVSGLVFFVMFFH